MAGLAVKVAFCDTLTKRRVTKRGAFEMGLSGWHLLILALVALLIFGGSGRISSIMGDVAKGIKSFKKGLSDDKDEGDTPEAPTKVIDHAGTAASERERDRSKTT
jgi:sec-independent protein translocase protein TatA